jgi:hypothetical protein
MGALGASDRRRRDAAVVPQVALHRLQSRCCAIPHPLQSSNSFEDVGT